MFPKLSLCPPVPNRNTEIQFWVKQKRIALFLCQLQCANALKAVSHPGVGIEKSYSIQGAGHAQFMGIFLIGW